MHMVNKNLNKCDDLRICEGKMMVWLHCLSPHQEHLARLPIGYLSLDSTPRGNGMLSLELNRLERLRSSIF